MGWFQQDGYEKIALPEDALVISAPQVGKSRMGLLLEKLRTVSPLYLMTPGC